MLHKGFESSPYALDRLHPDRKVRRWPPPKAWMSGWKGCRPDRDGSLGEHPLLRQNENGYCSAQLKQLLSYLFWTNEDAHDLDAHLACALRSRAGCRGNGGLSATATAYQPLARVRHASQLTPNQRHIYLVEVKYCADTRPRNQLNAAN